MQKIKKPVSIVLALMMVVSLFAAVPMTVNAAPPGSETGHALTLYANNGTDQQYTTGKQLLGITKISAPSYYQFTTPAGKNFRCWNTAADGTGTDYASGSDYVHRYADLTLYAQWGYTVTWKDWDSTLLKEEVLAEGTTPTYDGTTPTKAEDEKYTYTFAGWTPEITAVTGDVTYTAQYTATFKGITSDDLYEGLVLDEGTALKFMLMKSGERWKNGYLQVYLDDVLVKDLTVEGGPTTEPDRYYTTTKKCIVDSYEKYSNAHFIHLKSVYDVTWKNDDGTVLEKDENIVVGTTPTYDGTTPEKAEDEKYTYTFAGWSPEITAVTGDVTYTAQYTATFKGITSDDLYEGLVIDAGTPIKFMIIKSGEDWRRVDLSVYLDGTLVKELVTQYVSKTEPDRYYTTTKKCIVDSYEFSRGDPSRHVLYLKSLYTVTWKDEDGTVLKTEDVAKGDTPSYGATPTKAEDENYTYTFAGWTPEITAVTGDAEYTATFDATFKGILSGNLRKGLVIDAGTPIRFAMTKTEDSWAIFGLQVYLDDVLVKSVQTEQLQPTEPDRYYTTTKKCIVDSYSGSGNSYPRVYHTLRLKSLHTVTWKNADGTTLETDNDVAFGTTPTYNGTTPEKAEDANNTYTFAGWTPEITAVTGDAEYTATYTSTPKHVHEWDYDNPVWGEPIDDGTWQYEYNVNVTLTCKGDATHTKTLTATSGIVEEKEASCGEGGYKESVFSVTDEGHELSKRIRWAEEPANGEHQFYEYHAAVAPTVDSVGYEAYYECAECGKLFSDEEMTHEISAPVEIPKLKKLFAQHSVTLGGDIGVNFYIDSAAANFAGASEATVKFTWDGGGEEDRKKEVDLTKLPTNDDGYYKVTVDVVAAHMAHKIHAEVYLNGEKLDQTDDYSVQDYAEEVYNHPEKYDSEKPKKLQDLAQALLNYGAMAQTVFDEYLVEKPAPADTVKTVGQTDFSGITADQIKAAVNGNSADLNAVATDLGGKYYTSSVLYLQNNTLRIYFTPNTYPGTMPNGDKYTGSQSDYYYYVDHANIAAAELDDQQELTVGDYTFTYTALDYAAAVVNSDNMEPEQQNLAKALYLYNQAANAYFG